MEIKITFKGILNGVHCVWSGDIQKGARVEEVIPILYPDPKHKLRKKGTEELLDYVILKNDDTQENYEEVEDQDAK